MTKLGAVITLLVVLALGGLGYLGYLKNNPSADPSAVERWVRSGEVKKVVPKLLLVALGGVLVGVVIGGHRHHSRGNRAWSDFAEQLGLPCENAAFFGSDPSRVAGEAEGRAFSLETRIVRTRGGGQSSSSTHTDMKLGLEGAPEGLSVSSRTALTGSGFLGRMAQGALDNLIEARGLGEHAVETGNAHFDTSTRAFCLDQEAARSWLEPRAEALLAYLSDPGYTLEKGSLVHTSQGKTASLDELHARLSRLSDFAKTLGSQAEVV